MAPPSSPRKSSPTKPAAPVWHRVGWSSRPIRTTAGRELCEAPIASHGVTTRRTRQQGQQQQQSGSQNLQQTQQQGGVAETLTSSQQTEAVIPRVSAQVDPTTATGGDGALQTASPVCDTLGSSSSTTTTTTNTRSTCSSGSTCCNGGTATLHSSGRRPLVVAHTHSSTSVWSGRQQHTHKLTLLRSWNPGAGGAAAADFNTRSFYSELEVEMGLIDNTLNALMKQAAVKGPLSGTPAILKQANDSLQKQMEFMAQTWEELLQVQRTGRPGTSHQGQQQQQQQQQQQHPALEPAAESLTIRSTA